MSVIEQASTRRTAGFSLIECLTAMAVLVIGVPGILAMCAVAVEYQKHARDAVYADMVGDSAVNKLTVAPLRTDQLAAGTAVQDLAGLWSIGERSFPREQRVLQSRRFGWMTMAQRDGEGYRVFVFVVRWPASSAFVSHNTAVLSGAQRLDGSGIDQLVTAVRPGDRVLIEPTSANDVTRQSMAMIGRVKHVEGTTIHLDRALPWTDTVRLWTVRNTVGQERVCEQLFELPGYFVE